MSDAMREAVSDMRSRRVERDVAIGDSSTEGLDDPDGRGGFRGWADRLAQHVADAQGTLLYANLAVRGRRTRQVREEQLAPALAMRPDLSTVFAGTNDVVSRRFDPIAFDDDIEALYGALARAGATVLTFTLPDLSSVIPLAGRLTPRVERLNASIRAAAARTGAICLDLAAHPIGGDPRLWSDDRLHANAEGHTRIAAALAAALGVPTALGEWAAPFPSPWHPTRAERLLAHLAWGRRYLVPWLVRHAAGRSSGDGRVPKRPSLAPVHVTR